jgi:hypothetical protein
MGGCYYSGKLAVLEHLEKVQRQAKVFIFREAYPDYILPMGVWQVRENVRNAMSQEPSRFYTLREPWTRFSAGSASPWRGGWRPGHCSGTL